MCIKNTVRVTNSVDPDQTPRSAAPDLGLLCLFRHICPTTKDIHGRLQMSAFFNINKRVTPCKKSSLSTGGQ